jgi:hypothetical protein
MAPSHPEIERLARRAGTWDVTMTMRPTADAEPLVVTGLIAPSERSSPAAPHGLTVRSSKHESIYGFNVLRALNVNAGRRKGVVMGGAALRQASCSLTAFPFAPRPQGASLHPSDSLDVP